MKILLLWMSIFVISLCYAYQQPLPSQPPPPPPYEPAPPPPPSYDGAPPPPPPLYPLPVASDFTKVACEGEKLWLICNQYQWIRIKTVLWGRDDSGTCPNAPAGFSTEPCKTDLDNAFVKVNVQCKGEQACEVAASNIFFNDMSCGNIFKYLRVQYECVSQ